MYERVAEVCFVLRRIDKKAEGKRSASAAGTAAVISIVKPLSQLLKPMLYPQPPQKKPPQQPAKNLQRALPIVELRKSSADDNLKAVTHQQICTSALQRFAFF